MMILKTLGMMIIYILRKNEEELVFYKRYKKLYFY